jgi:DNA repair protein RadD
MYTLYDYQNEAIDAIFNYFYSSKRCNPLVVAPTGSGKSVIIADLCRQVITNWPEQKVLVVSHTKEVLGQNHKAIIKQCPGVDIGLYSAGMKSKTIGKITVAGIQSIYKKPELFNQFDVVIVDECHTIPIKKGMYHKLFEEIQVPIIGFTATPFRLGTGYLHLGKDAFFDEIVYTIEIKFLQDNGFLCQLSTKGTENRLDATGFKKQAGDYILKELSEAFDRELITDKIVKELLLYKQLRKKWLVFAIDIDHAEHINDKLREYGIHSAVVHSKMDGDREATIDDFKHNIDGYQALVSVAMLTVGFDSPWIDLVVILRPTASPVLHVQMPGRGLRTYDVLYIKDDCLVLDFAGNLFRNGPIDNPVVNAKGSGGGEAIMKECPQCREIVYAAVRNCPVCKFEFQFKHNLTAQAGNQSVLSREEWHNVTEVFYEHYVGTKGIPMLKVQYLCGVYSYKEFICIEHGGYATTKAKRWWTRRAGGTMPDNVNQALKLVEGLRIPEKILVNESGKYPNIKEQVLK